MSDEELRELFTDEDAVSMVTETGYRQVLSKVTLANKADLSKILSDYYTMIKILPQINQFGEGLDTVGVLSMISKHPDHMRPFFTDCQYMPINKGIAIHIAICGMGMH